MGAGSGLSSADAPFLHGLNLPAEPGLIHLGVWNPELQPGTWEGLTEA